ncbi:uncharacterized protein LOC122721398 [Manihot esculenta]|uniref:uncharacterized protein LOC122721398 n=1 Tax=Manihot esculenta TaxID=3983 RepID=UPI001CC40C0E|nr:uncharacterized protein LOC122721398 [Manihot esculenta]
MFLSFKPIIDGFKAGCRPFIGVDGCHLKGPFGGVLLSAISLDGDKGVIPLAIAIMEIECGASWDFFFDCLKTCIGPEDDETPLTFMSDRQKGLIQAVNNWFPEACHRFCARHMFNNFKKQYPGLGLKQEFWNAARATHGYEFWEAMKMIKRVKDGEPFDWLLKVPMSQWSRHMFWPEAKSEHLTNNMTESFNAWIGKIRGLPIVKLLDAFRQKCMVRLQKRYANGTSWEGKITPNARKTINSIIKQGKNCRLLPCRNDEFEVTKGNLKFAVKLQEKKCSCKWWDISGLPCKHAALCIGYMRQDIEDYCHYYYYISTYVKVYEGVIHPMPQANYSIQDESQCIMPPLLKRLSGRPRKARKREEGEAAPSNVRTKSKTTRCATCKQLGHNKRTCQRAPIKEKRKGSSSNIHGRHI